MRSRLRRNRTKLLNAVFDTEQLRYSVLLPGATAFTGTGAGGGSLYTANGGIAAVAAGQAANYQFQFNLGICNAVCPSYAAFSDLYDWFKIKKVQLTLKPSIDPKRDITVALQTGSSAVYDFSGALVYDPDMTLIDYDGIQTPIVCPANGDCTQFIYNRTGVRKHKAFGTIRRTFYPKLLTMHPQCGQNLGVQTVSPAYPNNAIYNTGTTYVNQVTSTYRKGPAYGWMRAALDNSFTGGLALFTSYKGSNAPGGGAGNQPNYVWAIQCKWFVSFRDTIYG